MSDNGFATMTTDEKLDALLFAVHAILQEFTAKATDQEVEAIQGIVQHVPIPPLDKLTRLRTLGVNSQIDLAEQIMKNGANNDQANP